MAGMNYDDETLEQMQTEAEGRTEVAYPLNDTAYIAEDAQLWHATRTQGVYSADDHLTTRAEGGMQVAVSEGIAWLKKSRFENCVYGNKEEKTLTVETADGRLPRLDRVVIRWDNITNTVKAKLKKGTPATNPQPPALERNAEAYELGIANVRVPAGALAITQANIQDTRLDEYACGIMRDGVTGIPTQTLIERWESWYNSFTDKASQSVEDKLAEFTELVGNATADVQASKKSFSELIGELADQSNTKYIEFASQLDEMLSEFNVTWEIWLSEKQDQLNEYPAGEWISKVEKTLGEIPEFKVLTLTREPFEFLNVKAFEVPMGLAWDIKSIPFEDSEIKTVNCVAINKPSGETEILVPNKYQADDWEQVAFEKGKYIVQSLTAKTNLHIEVTK